MFPRWVLALGVVVLGSLAWAQTTPSTTPATQPNTTGKPMAAIAMKPNVTTRPGANDPFNMPTVPAPLLESAPAMPRHDLGKYDSAFAFNGLDSMVVRREDDLFSLSMSVPTELKKLRNVPGKARVVTGIHAGDKSWLFLESPDGPSCAVEINSGQRVDFLIPGHGPAEQKSQIQSHVFFPQAHVAMLMISGGTAPWPREGNAPLYFWMSLESGKVTMVPIGKDLGGFTSDHKIALFSPAYAIDMSTGEPVPVPNPPPATSIPFQWTNTDDVKPVYAASKLAGFLVNDSTYLLRNIPFDGDTERMTARASDDFVAWSRRFSGGIRNEFCYAPLKNDAQAVRAGTHDVQGGILFEDFAFLGADHCVVNVHHRLRAGSERDFSEAFILDFNKQTVWNVLENVPRLAPLGPEYADKEYIADETRLRLIPSFGVAGESIALCIFNESREDMRQQFVANRINETWRRTVLVSSGRRFMTDLFRDADFSQTWSQVWLHKSGTIVTLSGDGELTTFEFRMPKQ